MYQELYNTIDKFITDESEESKNNANFIRSLPVLELLINSKIFKKYLFDVIYKDLPVIDILHNEGFIYHHQTSKLSPYCIGLSAYELVLKGLSSTATNERISGPPKRIDTVLAQAANLICLLSQEVSGATSVNDLSTIVASYLYYTENILGKQITDYELVNYWQSFLYNINLPFRSGNSPFSNITLDFSKSNPSIANKTVAIANTYLDITYSEIPNIYFDRVNKAFIDAMIRGDNIGNPFTFPLITVNITDDFDYSNEIWNYFVTNSDKFGGFYLQNYCTTPFNDESRKINPYQIPYDLGMLYSNCCRMIFNIKDLMAISGSNPFATASGVGGIGVININLNRILWLCQGDTNSLFEILGELLDLSAAALELKRNWLRKYWTCLYPHLSYYLKDDSNMFSILSVIGMHEGLVSFGFKEGLYSEEGKKLAHEISKFIREKVDGYISKYKSVFNLEYAPAENAAVDLAEKDLIFSNKISQGDLSILEKIRTTKGGEKLGELLIKQLE